MLSNLPSSVRNVGKLFFELKLVTDNLSLYFSYTKNKYINPPYLQTGNPSRAAWVEQAAVLDWHFL